MFEKFYEYLHIIIILVTYSYTVKKLIEYVSSAKPENNSKIYQL